MNVTARGYERIGDILARDEPAIGRDVVPARTVPRDQAWRAQHRSNTPPPLH